MIIVPSKSVSTHYVGHISHYINAIISSLFSPKKLKKSFVERICKKLCSYYFYVLRLGNYANILDLTPQSTYTLIVGETGGHTDGYIKTYSAHFGMVWYCFTLERY